MSDAPCLEQTCSGSGRADQVPKSKACGRTGRVRVLSQLKSWITVSEPSAQAFKKTPKGIIQQSRRQSRRPNSKDETAGSDW